MCIESQLHTPESDTSAFLSDAHRHVDRRGGGHGIAGVVKGLGIASLRGHGIMDALKAGIEDKSRPQVRRWLLWTSSWIEFRVWLAFAGLLNVGSARACIRASCAADVLRRHCQLTHTRRAHVC